MELIEVEVISEETRQLIEKLIFNSYEGSHLGLDPSNLVNVINGVEIGDNLARDNVFIYRGFDKIYIEELEGGMYIKDGLTEEEQIIASKQLDAYMKELAFISIVNHKIKTIHRLLLEGVLS